MEKGKFRPEGDNEVVEMPMVYKGTGQNEDSPLEDGPRLLANWCSPQAEAYL
jgi:hypothetical protein